MIEPNANVVKFYELLTVLQKRGYNLQKAADLLIDELQKQPQGLTPEALAKCLMARLRAENGGKL
jgi:hypothetical protein